MKYFVFGLLLGVAIPTAWNVLKERGIPIPSTPCQVNVTNATAEDVIVVPLSNDRHFSPNKAINVKSNEVASIRLTSGDCEGITRYPEGPILAFAAIDPTTQAIKAVKALNGSLHDVSITEPSNAGTNK